jgi:hypothetical protein
MGGTVQGIGSILGGFGAQSEGKTAERYSVFNAASDRAEGQWRASQDLAGGQQAAEEAQRQTQRVISAGRAAAAASGGGGGGAPSVMGVMTRTLQRGDYLAGTRLYAGQARSAADIAAAENRARVELMQGAAARARGKNAMRGALLGGAGSIAGSFTGGTSSPGSLASAGQALQGEGGSAGAGISNFIGSLFE